MKKPIFLISLAFLLAIAAIGYAADAKGKSTIFSLDKQQKQIQNDRENLNPVQNLSYTVVGQTVVLKWDAPRLLASGKRDVILTEGFESGIPTDWITIDANNDGHSFTTSPNGGSSFMGHTGIACVSSASFDSNSGYLTPDNWLITSAVNLPNGGNLTFWVSAQNKEYSKEHYAVYAFVSDEMDFSNPVPLLEETFSEEESLSDRRAQTGWVQKNISLPAGTKHVAFRHFKTDEGQDWINFDDIEISAEGPSPLSMSYQVYCDGDMVAENMTDNTYTEESVSFGIHDYCVMVKYDMGVSEKKCVSVEVSPEEDLLPVSELTGTVDENHVILNWSAPQNRNREVLLSEDFDGGKIPIGWSTIDADKDGYNWRWTAEAGQDDPERSNDRVQIDGKRDSRCLVSESSLFDESKSSWTALHPDNYIVTPKVEGATKLTYKVGSVGAPNYSNEHYAVCISKTGKEKDDFQIIKEETLTYSEQTASFERSIDLPAGTKYVAFRHFNCSNILGILIDDVEITGEASIPSYTYSVYRDGIQISEGLTETNYTDEVNSSGEYDYCVEVVYSTGSSPKKCVKVECTLEPFPPVQNLTGAANNGNVTLRWDIPKDAPNPPVGGVKSLKENFDFGEMPIGWTTIDADGDGYAWTPSFKFGEESGHEKSAGMIASASFVSVLGGEITPDNYLVTPELNLPNGGTFTFWVCSHLANYPAEHYAVYASVGGHEVTDFTSPLLEQTIARKVVETSNPERAQTEWVQQSIQLPAGTKYVAIRHFNCTGQFYIDVDDVVITPNKKRKEVLNEGFETSTLPEGWSLIDADNDGFNWETTIDVYNTGAHTGIGAIFSRSWSSETRPNLYPNNYLVTPKITIPENGNLTYWVSSQASFKNEHYGVFLSTTGAQASDFTVELFSETLGSRNVNSEIQKPDTLQRSPLAEWQKRTVDLSAYAGQQVYLAFRHYDTSGVFRLYLDDIVVSDAAIDPPTPTPSNFTYTVYRNGSIIAENLKTTTYEDQKVAAGSYNYCVEVRYKTGLSPKKCVDVAVKEYLPVTNLDAKSNNDDVVVTWDAPKSNSISDRGVVLNEDFETGVLPTGWTTLDVDNDSYTWDPAFLFQYGGGHEGSAGLIASASFMNGGIGALTPDNYLITPELNLVNGGSLTFWVCAQDNKDSAEHYAVYASTAGNAVTDFTNALLEETIGMNKVMSADLIRGTRDQSEWMQKTVILPAGTKYVAFRHFDTKGMYYLDLDDVKITEEGSTPIDFTYTIFRDGSKIKEGLTETIYKDLDMAANNHEYCVEVQYPTGVSPKACVNYVASSIEDVTVAKPYTIAVVGKTITITSNGDVMIYDMNGRRVAVGSQVLSYIAQSGFYAVRIAVDGKTYIEKLVIK